MFKNREIRIELHKKADGESQDAPTTIEEIDERADLVLHKVERLMAKVFIGIVIYVALDTGRQVAVAKANQT